MSFPCLRGSVAAAVLLLGADFVVSSEVNAQGVSSAAPASTVPLGEVVVFGRSRDLIGDATSAAEGEIGAPELAVRPFLRRGELLEVIPGVIITQHSGDGKANQYFLRGFDLDHGTDFASSVDGLPVNMRTNAHGQGYSDLNFIIPEFVENISYQKGQSFAENGDFSAAGAAQFHLFDALPRNFAKIELGENEYARLVLGDTEKHGAGGLTTLGFEAGYNNGPWVQAEDASHFSGLARQSWSAGDNEFKLTALGYHGDWNSTDQVPFRAIAAGTIDRFGNIDPTDGGSSDRDSLSFDWINRGSNATTRLNLYAIYYRLSLFSDFTYFLVDPVNGDQFNQRERRGVFGGSLERTWTGALGAHKSETTVGAQLREDAINVGLFDTVQRRYLATVRSDDVNEGSIGLFAKNVLHVNDWFRIESGLRGDAYRFKVDSDLPANSGTRTATIASPKLNLTFGPWDKTELYLNGGYGFHSNDARGVLTTVDPGSGLPVERAKPLVRALSAEAGVRTSFLPGLVSTVSFWALDLDSELVFSGDSGGTEASGPTRRYGVELANFYRATPWLAFDADLSFTHARYRDREGDAPNAGTYLPNSIGTVLTAGSVVNLPSGWFGSLRVRYFGPQPLIEDDSVQGPSSLTFNGRVGWRHRDWEAAVDVLNLLDRANDDIAYYYESQLKTETAPVADIHLHPAEERTFRVSVTRRF
ncbi:MAG TPA: TonB-dependent receptor [Opitutaceae bacterium]|nr:TonB-dependent receptor [Opitutaceae bacterium]